MISCLSSAEVDIKVVEGLFMKSKKTYFFSGVWGWTVRTVLEERGVLGKELDTHLH